MKVRTQELDIDIDKVLNTEMHMEMDKKTLSDLHNLVNNLQVQNKSDLAKSKKSHVVKLVGVIRALQSASSIALPTLQTICALKVTEQDMKELEKKQNALWNNKEGETENVFLKMTKHMTLQDVLISAIDQAVKKQKGQRTDHSDVLQALFEGAPEIMEHLAKNEKYIVLMKEAKEFAGDDLNSNYMQEEEIIELLDKSDNDLVEIINSSINLDTPNEDIKKLYTLVKDINAEELAANPKSKGKISSKSPIVELASTIALIQKMGGNKKYDSLQSYDEYGTTNFLELYQKAVKASADKQGGMLFGGRGSTKLAILNKDAPKLKTLVDYVERKQHISDKDRSSTLMNKYAK